MKMKKILSTLLIAILGAVIGLFAFTRLLDDKPEMVTVYENPVDLIKLPDASLNADVLDFVKAAELTIHAVVHVKTESVKETYYRNPIYEFFYGEKYKESKPMVGIGSGVIVSDNGYMVTNNHVIDNSEKIFVTLNDKREFEAELIGNDPSSDLAVLKIESEGLDYIPYGNSDELKVGEWVLAVGNPFNLTSTVTAGIVSAKGRFLGIIDDQYRLESFIQTDAAVNRGNSGGALVNTRGELIGINTAIISPSGGSVGNSFAIPVSIVKKVVNDIIEFGTVQRAILGVSIKNVNSELAKDKGFNQIIGVYITETTDDGAARDAGIKAGDVIIEINDVIVNSTSELQEKIGRYRPGDKIKVSVIRDNKKKLFEVVLRNMQGEAQLVKPYKNEYLYGALFKTVSLKEKRKLNISNGVKVSQLKKGKLSDEGVKEGFIVIEINNKTINNINEIALIIENIKDGIYIKGIYPNGEVAYYAFEK